MPWAHSVVSEPRELGGMWAVWLVQEPSVARPVLAMVSTEVYSLLALVLGTRGWSQAEAEAV